MKNKQSKRILIFTTISSAVILLAIVYSGIGNFIVFWLGTTFIYTIGIVIAAVLIYAIARWIILRKKEIGGYRAPEFVGDPDLDADKDLGFDTCPKCEEEGFYFRAGMGDIPIVIICWKCQHEFSFAWCPKCGIGGSFIDLSASRLSSWACRNCQSVYPLPIAFYENPIRMASWEQLPANVRISHTERQRRFALEQAGVSVLLFASLLLSFSLIWPVMNSFAETFSKLRIGSELNSESLAVSCTAFIGYVWIFVTVWYALMFSSLMLFRKIGNLHGGTNENENP